MEQDAGATPTHQLRLAMRADERGEPERAFALAEDALRQYEAARDHEGAAAALQLMAGLALQRGSAHEACKYLEHALGLREAHRDVAEQLSLLRDLVAARLQLGDPASAVGAARKALALAETSGDRDAVLQATHQLAHLLVDQRALDEAERRIEDGLASATAPGDLRARAALVILRSRVQHARGDVDRAREHAEHALELAEEAKFRPVIADAVHHLARILLAVGDIGAARRRLLEAVDARVILRDGRGKAVALQELAALETALGDHAAALVCLRDAASVYLDAGMHGPRVDVLGVIASLEERAGNLGAAVEAGAEAVRAAYQVGPDAAFRALLGHAERLTGLGELGAAADALGSIVDLPGVEPAQRATGLAMRGQVLFALGHEGPAIAALVAARDLFLPLDAAAAAEVDEILAELAPHPN